MSKKKLAILPKLNDGGGDLKKKWFVYYSVRNPRTDKMERFKVFEHLGKEHTKKGRYETAGLLVRELSEKLQNGWTPFDSNKSGIIYEDELTYHSAAEIYKQKRTNNSTFHYFANLYITEQKRDHEPESIRNYKSVLRRFIFWAQKKGIADNDITAYTQQIMADFFIFFIDDLKRAGRTIKRYRNVLHGVFEIARKAKKIKHNPVYDMPGTTRINDHAPRPISEADIRIFLKEIKKQPQLYLAVLLQMYCFIRPGNELRNLKIGDIDLERNTIRILKSNAKTREQRIVTMPDFLSDILRNEYKLNSYNRNYFLFCRDGIPGTTMLGKNQLRKKFNEIRSRLKMPDSYKLYSWKHTGGVLAEDMGIPLHVIQAQMGHKNILTTVEYLRRHGGMQNPHFKTLESRF